MNDDVGKQMGWKSDGKGETVYFVYWKGYDVKWERKMPQL